MTEVLTSGPAQVTIDLDDGGRLSSFVLDGHEMLYHAGDDPIMHGSFVMAPYAGRVRHGRFVHRGREVRLPLSLPPHGGHGLVLDRPWTLLERTDTEATLACPFDERWPFGGRVVQHLELTPQALEASISVEADHSSFPASAGWHPWFARHLGHAPPAQVGLAAGAMLVRDADYIATRQRMPPRPGPWDDCFVNVDWPVTISWPGLLQLDISADTPCVVVFDEGEVAVCVEPQTDPPDSLNTSPRVGRPGRPQQAHMRWEWFLTGAGRPIA